MSFPTQWKQQQQSLQRHVVPVPTGNSMQRVLPNSMGGMGSFLGFMPANPMPTQTIPPSVQVNVPAVQVKTIVVYPSSVKEAFCDWKEQFLNGEIEPHNPDFPVKTRWRYWKKYLSSKWSTYDWTRGYEFPKVKTMEAWTRSRRESLMSASRVESRDSLHSQLSTTQHRKRLGIRTKVAQREASGSENSRSAHSSTSPPRKKIRFGSGEPVSSPRLPPTRKQVLK